MKFKNYIETESGIKDTSVPPAPGTVGTAGQVLSSTVTGTSWIDQGEIIAAAATVVAIECKNTHTTPLTKGTPVYQTGTVGATDVIEIAPGNALVSTGAQPSIGLLQQDLAINEFGYVIITGELLNITTDPIDGLTPVTGQKVFVKSGGGLTLTKPTTELNSIQNMGLVGKVSGGNAGSITVSSIMRTNDVPNLPEGRIWIGDGNTIVSDTVYVDELNGRVGIGTILPGAELEVVGGNGVIIDSGTSSQAKLTLIGDASIYGGGGTIDVIGGSSDYISYNLNVKRSPNTMEAYNQYNMNYARWSWDGNIGATRGQPYTSYDFKSQGSSQMVIYNNNVGIGTTSPQEKLHVSGSSNVRLEVEATDSTVAALKLTNTAGSYGSFVNASGSLNTYDYNAASVRTTLLTNGNFGIGTTNPSSKLHVEASLSGPIDYTQRSAILGLNDSTDTVYANSVGVAGRVKTSNGRAIYGEAQGGGWGGYFDGKGFFSSNVGIGTTVLTSISSSSSTLSLGSASATTSGGIAFQVSGGIVKAYNYVASNYLINQTVSGIGQIFYGAGSERMRIHNTTGNVGINTTGPSQKLHVVGSGYFQNGNVYVGTTSNVMFNYISTFVIAAGSGQTIALGGGPGNVNNNVLIGNGDLSVSGNVGIGITTPSQKLHVVGRVASTAGNGFQIINSYGSPLLSDFYGSFTTTSPLYVGGPYSGQACYASAFNITSDYRLKENEAPLTEASSRIKKLKPIRFNYISSENTVDGFLAHEVAEVIPEAVTGEKDAVREDGSDELQGLDLSKIVPLLTAALQESITKIEQLEQRIQTLENK